MLVCGKCKSPALKNIGKEETGEHEWKEFYKCKNCDNIGIKIIDDDPKLRRPHIKNKGLKWEKEV